MPKVHFTSDRPQLGPLAKTALPPSDAVRNRMGLSTELNLEYERLLELKRRADETDCRRIT